MILGRSTNLWNGLVVALVSFASIVAMQLYPDADSELIATIAAAFTLLMGTIIALIANGAPTVRPGDTVNVQTPGSAPNREVTVG